MPTENDPRTEIDKAVALLRGKGWVVLPAAFLEEFLGQSRAANDRLLFLHEKLERMVQTGTTDSGEEGGPGGDSGGGGGESGGGAEGGASGESGGAGESGGGSEGGGGGESPTG